MSKTLTTTVLAALAFVALTTSTPTSALAFNVKTHQAALKNVRPLLNLIGLTEGTDKGDGYNETLSYGKFTNGDVILVTMTLAEIDALQTKMLRHPANKWNSSALGRYQIVRTTLRTLKKRLHLNSTDKFTAQLQDRLALELLKGRGYSKWKARKRNTYDFGRALSKEWASLPNPYTGRGYYAGQHTPIAAKKLLDVLNRVR